MSAKGEMAIVDSNNVSKEIKNLRGGVIVGEEVGSFSLGPGPPRVWELWHVDERKLT